MEDWIVVQLHQIERVWLSYWTLTVKPRGQAYAAGEVLGRLPAPIDHLGRGLVAVRCADLSPLSIVRRSASYGFRRDSCRLPRRCQYQAPSQGRQPAFWRS